MNRQNLSNQAESPLSSMGTRLILLDALKATGILMVVAVHVLTKIQLDGPNQKLVGFLVGAIAVPLFFLVDGFLFSWKWTGVSQFNYLSYVRKSAVRLLVPWVVFTLIYLALRATLESHNLTTDTILLGKGFIGWIKVIYLSEISPHMYFLLSLFLIRLGSFGLYRVLGWSSQTWASVGLLYGVVYQVVHPKEWFLPGADPVLLAFWGLQFYCLGIVLQKADAFVRRYLGGILILCGGATIIMRYLTLEYTGMMTQVLYLVAIYSAIFLVTLHTSWRFALGSETMGVYLLHSPVLVWVIAGSVSRVYPAGGIIGFLVATCLTVVASWYLAIAINRSKIGRTILGQP
jgi:fucose 4-O-acetylase-like acetyltransferase